MRDDSAFVENVCRMYHPKFKDLPGIEQEKLKVECLLWIGAIKRCI